MSDELLSALTTNKVKSPRKRENTEFRSRWIDQNKKDEIKDLNKNDERQDDNEEFDGSMMTAEMMGFGSEEDEEQYYEIENETRNTVEKESDKSDNVRREHAKPSTSKDGYNQGTSDWDSSISTKSPSEFRSKSSQLKKESGYEPYDWGMEQDNEPGTQTVNETNNSDSKTPPGLVPFDWESDHSDSQDVNKMDKDTLPQVTSPESDPTKIDNTEVHGGSLVPVMRDTDDSDYAVEDEMTKKQEEPTTPSFGIGEELLKLINEAKFET